MSARVTIYARWVDDPEDNEYMYALLWTDDDSESVDTEIMRNLAELFELMCETQGETWVYDSDGRGERDPMNRLPPKVALDAMSERGRLN